MIDEEWRPIPDHEGYEVSSKGRVRSIDRWIIKKTGRCFRRGRILKAHAVPNAPRHADRYAHVMCGRGRMRRVHQLVAWAFLGPQPTGLYVCHRDGDITRNHDDNLYYGTATQNQLDRRMHGRLGIGADHPNARLTEAQVLSIRARIDDGEKQSDLAREFGVTPSAISEIKTRARWAHV